MLLSWVQRKMLSWLLRVDWNEVLKLGDLSEFPEDDFDVPGEGVPQSAVS